MGSDRLRLGLLVVGHVDARSVHIAGDYPALFADLLAAHDVDIVAYATEHGERPASLRECDGWICSPSRASVYDAEPWIADAQRLHLEILDAGVPYVGICFGHQLLAQGLGATVVRSAGGWGVGVQRYDVVEAQRWMEPAPGAFSLLASHQDQVVEVPDGARLLATAPYCPVAGLAVGDHAWTIQAHPEFVAPLALHLLALRVEMIGADRVEQARATMGEPLDRPLIASWMAAFFRGTHGARDPAL